MGTRSRGAFVLPQFDSVRCINVHSRRFVSEKSGDQCGVFGQSIAAAPLQFKSQQLTGSLRHIKSISLERRTHQFGMQAWLAVDAGAMLRTCLAGKKAAQQHAVVVKLFQATHYRPGTLPPRLCDEPVCQRITLGGTTRTIAQCLFRHNLRSHHHCPFIAPQQLHHIVVKRRASPTTTIVATGLAQRFCELRVVTHRHIIPRLHHFHVMFNT